ncbi:MAG: ATP-binding cassette domain-containing protein [Bacteroidales bacterium]|nr:ATP-binding cassette domain-containing protein [Bacteroidales bacterium]
MSESEVSGSDIYLQPRVLFERGKKYMVCAKSGHGKTSLLNFIYGSNRQFDGTIDYHEPVSDPFLLRRDKLSYLFQDLCLFADLTAMENVQLKNRITGYKSDAEIAKLLDTLLPSEKKQQPVRTLSLGQRQRVAAVRAICQPFEFLMLDEPFSHIDNDNAKAVAQVIADEVERQGAGLIVTALDRIDLFQFDRILNL